MSDELQRFCRYASGFAAATPCQRNVENVLRKYPCCQRTPKLQREVSSATDNAEEAGLAYSTGGGHMPEGL